MTKFVIYAGTDEIFITTKKNEEEFIADFFGDATGRDIDDFDRNLIDDNTAVISFNVDMTIS